ncbi:MAG: TolC family protein [Bacteroidota bacterium]
MKQIMLIIGSLLLGTVYGQVADILTLEYCHEMALVNYPLSDHTSLLKAASEIEQKKLNANYLPRVQISGQVSYQSDVTKVDVVVPPFYIPPPIDIEVSPAPFDTPVPPKDQYRITMDINQVIYDGGITGKQKKMELAAYEIEEQKVEVVLHQLKESINSVFFSIILMQENEKLLSILMDEMNQKLKEINAAVEYGVALSTDRDVLKAEILRIEQQLDETSIQKQAFTMILGDLMSEDIPEEVMLALPENDFISFSHDPLRPELQIYDMQKSMLEDSKELITSTWNPKLSGFGQLGYGNPGLNMLEDNFSPFYIVGARLQWQIWNWNQNKKEKQILGLRQDMIDKEKETFDIKLNVALKQHIASISKYETLIVKDMEVIELRENISKTASSQLNNGVITSSDYVSRLNEEAQSRLNLELHKVRLAQARVDYLTTLGIL